MTSKISYIKFIRSDIRRRGWLAALTCIVLVFMMPVFATIQLDSAQIGQGNYENLWIVDVFPGMLNGANFWPLMGVIPVLAVLIALTGFSYIHSREKLDFYHSLPLRRGQWFTVSYISGLVMFVLPYFICSVLTILSAYINGITDPEILWNAGIAAAGGLLAFLLFYHTSLAAVMLTGQTVTGLLATLVLSVYPSMVLALLSPLKNAFFDSYYLDSYPASFRLSQYLSPGSLSVKLMERTANDTANLALILGAVAMAACLLAVAAILYRFHPSETAGNALAFPVIAPVVKVMICIPTALFSGLVLQNFSGAFGTKWLIFLSLLVAVILCAVIEFIYRQDLRQIFRGWISSLISIAAVAVILCVLQFDLIGYNDYLPEEDQIESISFRPDSFTGYFSYPEESFPDVPYTDYCAPALEYEPLYTLAQTGIRNLKNGITPEAYNMGTIGDTDTGRYINAVFYYNLDNGKTVSRQYCLEYDQTLDALETLCQNKDYREKLFPVFHLEQDSISDIYLTDIYGLPEKLSLGSAERQELLDAYKKDLLNVDVRTLASETPVGELALDFANASSSLSGQVSGGPHPFINSGSASGQSVSTHNVVSIGSLYIYPEYTNTLDYLEKSGNIIRTEIAAGDVTSITLHPAYEAVQNGDYDELFSQLSEGEKYDTYSQDELEYGNGITITSHDDIEILVKYLKPNHSGLLGSNDTYSGFAEVYYTEGTGNYSYTIL